MTHLLKNNLFNCTPEFCDKIVDRISFHSNENKEPVFILLTYKLNERKIVLGIETLHNSIWFSAVYYKQYVNLYSIAKRVEDLKKNKKTQHLSKIPLRKFNLKKELILMSFYIQSEWPEIKRIIEDEI